MLFLSVSDRFWRLPYNFPLSSNAEPPMRILSSFSHTFTFSSCDQSAGRDVVPLEPWSIAVAHEERKNGLEEKERDRERMDFSLCPTLYVLAWAMWVSSKILESV